MYIEIINEEFDPWQKLVEYKRAQLKDKTILEHVVFFSER